MKTQSRNRKFAIIAAVILVAGLILAGIGFLSGGMKSVEWVRGKGFVVASEEDNDEIVKVDETFDSFKDIDLNIDTLEKITLKEGDTFSVVGENYEKLGGLKAELQGEKLIVSSQSENLKIMNFDFISAGKKCEVVITYPKDALLGNVVLKSSLSDLEVHGMNAGDLNFDVDTGDVLIENVKSNSVIGDVDLGECELRGIESENLDVTADTGDLTMENVNSNKSDFEISLGTAEFTNVNLGSSEVKVDTGDVIGTDFRANGLIMDVSLGSIKLTNAIIEGTSEIVADTGDVNIEFAMKESDFSYVIDTDLGDVKINGEKKNGSVNVINNASTSSLKIAVDLGSVTLAFK